MTTLAWVALKSYFGVIPHHHYDDVFGQYITVKSGTARYLQSCWPVPQLASALLRFCPIWVWGC